MSMYNLDYGGEQHGDTPARTGRPVKGVAHPYTGKEGDTRGTEETMGTGVGGTVSKHGHPPKSTESEETTSTISSGAKVYREVEERHNQIWYKHFDKPMRLGVKKKLAIITCMDSRLPVETMFGLGVGDAEVIRNAGGRVTPDVLRSVIVCQVLPFIRNLADLLDCNAIMVMHHDDCGGQAVARRHDELINKLSADLRQTRFIVLRFVRTVAWYWSYLIPKFLRKMATDAILMPIYQVDKSVLDDMKTLRNSPFINKTTSINGYIYHVETGKLEHIATDERLEAGQ